MLYPDELRARAQPLPLLNSARRRRTPERVLRRARTNRIVPVENFLAGPHERVVAITHMLENPANFPGPVGHAHAVGMQGKTHDPGRARLGGGVFDQLVKLPDRPVTILLRPVALDQLHRQIIELLGIGQPHNRTLFDA